MGDLYSLFSETQGIPISDFFSKKVLFRDKETGDMQLDLYKFSELLPSVFEYFIKDPSTFLDILKNEIINRLELFPAKIKSSQNFEASTLPKNISNFKIINFPLSFKIHISHLRSENINKLIVLSGILKTVVQATSKIEEITWECTECGANISRRQTSNIVLEPNKCSCGKKGSFIKISEIYSNIQEMEVEENIDEIGSRQPQKIRLFLEEELTDPNFNKFQVGNKVEVIGILKKLPDFLSRKDPNKLLLEYSIKVLNIRNLEPTENEIVLSDEDMTQIREISAGNPLQTLADNIAPSVFGLDEIKKAIVLFLAKGVSKNVQEGERRRGEIHVLICGEPGVAKSVILQNIQRKTYNSRLADGKNASKAGLVSAVQKDIFTQRYALEAGDMVLCNGGYLFIDEFEKVSDDDKKALHRPMEQGEVAIDKCGVRATLKSETSILACCNPRMGIFSYDLPIINQIEISPTLLSRFDLIFILKDTPNFKDDEIKAKQILRVHQGKVNLKLNSDIIKKYFNYVSKLKPIITEEISEKITKIYSNVRSLSMVNGQKQGLPITPRHLEALIRLSEASAKIRLSDKVEISDVNIAEEIFMISLGQFGYDKDMQVIDLSKITTKIKLSKKDLYYQFLSLLKDLTKRISKELPRELIIEEAQRKFSLNYGECLEILNLLHQNVDIIECSRDKYQLTGKNV